MKTYRYGIKENLLGDSWYCIQRKTWIGWLDYMTYLTKEEMLDVVRQLKNKPNTIVVSHL